MTLLEADRATWLAVCAADDLITGRGVAALVAGRAVAVFLLDDGEVCAVDNVDPCSGASVLSRGIVGATVVDGSPVRYVASPLRKQRFDLETGRCLDADEVIDLWPARVVDGVVEVSLEPSRRGNGPETIP
ncbi:MAG: nitrite reductase small subunit [Ilumatobacteraceae bacterium]|nr:nitrite reductase small subunit [Ilumatobacteraceae bacterium]